MDAPVELVAGPLSMTLQGAALRWIRWHGVEVIRGIELTVRDPMWGTVEPIVVDREVSAPDRDGRVVVAIDVLSRQGDIHLATTVTLMLAPGGSLAYSVQCRALSSFRYNRIGIICLHPID